VREPREWPAGSILLWGSVPSESPCRSAIRQLNWHPVGGSSAGVGFRRAPRGVQKPGNVVNKGDIRE